ncbi:MAG: hypothetical protein Q9216_006625 [Gyalolechia sp. 2 TL-2023]
MAMTGLRQATDTTNQRAVTVSWVLVEVKSVRGFRLFQLEDARQAKINVKNGGRRVTRGLAKMMPYKRWSPIVGAAFVADVGFA